jgi:hypothetical protein
MAVEEVAVEANPQDADEMEATVDQAISACVR